MQIGPFVITRDSAVWWFGIIGGILTGIAANQQAFPWIPASAQHWIGLGAFIVGIISGKMATSPLRGENDPPAGSVKTSRFPPAAMILLAAAIGFGVPMTVSSCAKASAPVLNPSEVTAKRLSAVKKIGDVVAAVQAQEILLYQAGNVPADVHQQIQLGFKDASAAVLAALDVLDASGDSRAVVQAVSDAVKRLAAEIGHLTAKQAAQLAGWLDTGAALVDLALS